MQVGLLSHELFSNEPFTEREAWLWMIAQAAWKETKHRVGTKVHVVPVGSFFTTLREMQEKWQWKSDFRVRSFLRVLEKEGMIKRTENARKTQISICNYLQYQDGASSENAQKTHQKRTKDTKDNSLRSLSLLDDKPNVKKNGTRIPDDFKPESEWIASTGLPIEVLRGEFVKFRDYWKSKAGRGATKLDWEKTWRNWVRNSKAFESKNGKAGKPKTVGDTFRELAEREGMINGDAGFKGPGLFDQGNTRAGNPMLELVVSPSIESGDEPNDFTSGLLRRIEQR